MSHQKVVLIHGLFCRGWVMLKMANKLKKRGYQPLCVSYRTHKNYLADNALALESTLRKFKGEDSLFFVGHSMGGLMIRYLQHFFPDLFINSRVVTLGTPHQGCRAALKVHQHWPAFVLGKSWKNSLDGQVPAWNKDIPLLCIGGTRSSIENRIVKAFHSDEVNDGLVGLEEAQAEGMSDFKTVNQYHIELILSEEVVQLVDDWFKAK